MAAFFDNMAWAILGGWALESSVVVTGGINGLHRTSIHNRYEYIFREASAMSFIPAKS